MDIVVISDTHGLHRDLDIPDGDVLVHAGDITAYGHGDELIDINAWMGTLPHEYKIVVAGNHDRCFERDKSLCEKLLSNAIYLQDSSVELNGIVFYGSPWQPAFCNWSFNLPRNSTKIASVWDMIPEGIDVLITHGPPHGILDQNLEGHHCGCERMPAAIQRVKPKVHIFGHIHHCYGQVEIDGVRYVNAASCGEDYKATNVAQIIRV